MDGRIGPITILPDQMNIFNSLSVLITILLFEAWVYPAVNKVFTLTPLRKIAIGGILTGVAFVMSGLLQVNWKLITIPVLIFSSKSIKLWNQHRQTVIPICKLSEPLRLSSLPPVFR